MIPGTKMHSSLLRLRDNGFLPAGILDIGAYNGDWTRGVRTVFPDAFILMVDALADREHLLREAAKKVGNADLQIAMLGDRELPNAEYFVVNAFGGSVQTGSSRYKENTNFPMETRIISQRTAATVLSKYVNKFQLLKMDIQGSELDVLKGFGHRLGDVEVVMMEISVAQYNQGAPLIPEVLTTLAAFGFLMYDIVEESRIHNELMQIDGVFVRSDSKLLPKPPFM